MKTLYVALTYRKVFLSSDCFVRSNMTSSKVNEAQYTVELFSVTDLA